MAKMVLVSDSPTIPTGYGNVIKVLATAFQKAGNIVDVIGWGYDGSLHNLPFRIIPCDPRQTNFGEDILDNYIKAEKPDIVFTLGDPWMFQSFQELESIKTACWIAYFPLDGYPVPKDWEPLLKNIDVPVVFSHFAEKLFKGVTGKSPLYIPHGVNTEVFKPLGNKLEIKKQMLGRDDLFVVGCVARNQPRKNLPALIKAFSEFAKGKDDVALYLHSQIRDVGWNLDELVERFGITDKAYSTSNFTALNGITQDKLNELYNMFDVMALPTMAEGFGLPILESQSSGTPVLVTDFSACPELVVDSKELIRVKDTLIMGRGIEQAIADTQDLAHKLNYFYRDWKRGSQTLQRLSEKGREKAEIMDWNIICDSFLELIKKVEPKAKQLDKTIKPNFYRI